MYLRAAHAEHSIPMLRQFMHQNPLGILTTGIASPIYQFLQSSHIPWVLDVEDPSSETELGTLRGHMARANPHSKAMIDILTKDDADDKNNATNGTNGAHGARAKQLQDDVMILFNGPAHHYVTPKFYVDTKPATGKVVPTWNYSAVQAYGRATVYFDPKAEDTIAYLSRQIRDVSQHLETSVMGHVGGEGRPTAWQVADAPENYIQIMMKAIIGIKVEITSLGGKWKMSQELGAGDRAGVVEGFKKLNTETGLVIAETVKERAELDVARKNGDA